MKMAFLRSQTIRQLYKSIEIRSISSLVGSCRSYDKFDVGVRGFCYRSISTYASSSRRLGNFPWISKSAKPLHSTMVIELSALSNHNRSVTTQAKAPPRVRQMGAKISMLSPGIVYEPYAPREPISFLRRWFTRSGWRRTKEDIILELKSAYAIAKLRKSGYSKKQFYQEAAQLYKEINTLISDGDKTSLRKFVTENMYSGLKNEIKQRESVWSSVYWELIEPVVKIRTLRARLIGVDRNDLSKVFVQLTLEILSKQKFEAYNSKGLVIAGDKSKEVLVRDIWVFEKSLFHQGAYWRLCGRISV